MFFLMIRRPPRSTLFSLHDALPIFRQLGGRGPGREPAGHRPGDQGGGGEDRKSTRLNSSHGYISYAVFCLKKKKPPDVAGRPSPLPCFCDDAPIIQPTNTALASHCG